MYGDQGSHPLLAQVPLTVSPFISLPTAVTLPYTYKTVPSSLPASVTVDSAGGDKAKYVLSPSGHAAHPDEIIASCKAVQEHIEKTKLEGERAIQKWENDLKERELAEKRRVAPGWLDRDEKLLEPTRAKNDQNLDLLDRQNSKDGSAAMAPAIRPSRDGEELDRAFGGPSVQ